MDGLVAKLDGFPSFRVDWLLDISKAGLLDTLKSKFDILPDIEPLVESWKSPWRTHASYSEA
jgi:hypothetical protein